MTSAPTTTGSGCLQPLQGALRAARSLVLGCAILALAASTALSEGEWQPSKSVGEPAAIAPDTPTATSPSAAAPATVDAAQAATTPAVAPAITAAPIAAPVTMPAEPAPPPTPAVAAPSAPSAPPFETASTAPRIADAAVALVRDRLAQPQRARGIDRTDLKALQEFYAAADARLVWVAPSGELTTRGKAVRAEITKADDWGLDVKAFELPAVFLFGGGALLSMAYFARFIPKRF